MSTEPDRDLFLLVRDGDVEALRAASGVCGARPYGRPLVVHAVLEDRPDVLAALLEAGCAPDAASDDGLTALHAAAQRNDAGAARRLLEAGAPADAGDAHGNTPLLEAVFVNPPALKVIDVLLAHGADPGRANGSGVTPRAFAERTGKAAVLERFERGST